MIYIYDIDDIYIYHIYIPACVCVQMSQMSQMSGSHANPRIGAQNPSCGSIWMRMWSRCWSLGIDTKKALLAPSMGKTNRIGSHQWHFDDAFFEKSLAQLGENIYIYINVYKHSYLYSSYNYRILYTYILTGETNWQCLGC